MTPLLEHWLALAYQARVLQKGDWADTKRRIRERFDADQGLAAEARAELQRLNGLHAHSNGELQRRDFVSHVHRETLLAVIDNQP